MLQEGGGKVFTAEALSQGYPPLADKAVASACVNPNSTRRSRGWQPALADGSRRLVWNDI
jgi:hypothetical protein